MDVAAVIRAHGGVATRSSLLAEGVSSAALSRAVAAGETVRIAPAVYRCGTAHAVARLRAAAGASGAVSHDSAAALWGLDLLREPGLHVTVSRNRSRARFPGVTVHRGEVDGVQCRGVATTSVLRTVLDCARVLPLREAVVVADSAMRQGLMRHEALLSVKVTGRGAVGVRRVVRLADPRAGSVLESLLRVLLAEYGLHPPYTQYLVYGEFGPVARADFAWPYHRLLVEADGFEYHRDRETYRQDRRRANAFVSLGWRLLRFSWEDVWSHGDYVVQAIRDELTRV